MVLSGRVGASDSIPRRGWRYESHLDGVTKGVSMKRGSSFGPVFLALVCLITCAALTLVSPHAAFAQALLGEIDGNGAIGDRSRRRCEKVHSAAQCCRDCGAI